MTPPAKPRQTLGTVTKALAVLRRFTPERRWLGVRELSRELGLNNATVQHILSTLAAEGFVEQDPASRKYQLGLALVEIAGTKLAQLDLVTVAQPSLNRLMRETGETVNLAVLYRGQALYLAKVETSQPIRVASRIGGHAPLHASAHGKALLAFAGRAETEACLAGPLPRFTAATITEPAALAAELAAIRERGYALDRGGYIEHLNAVAVPVADKAGRLVASVGIVAPAQRMDEPRLLAALPSVRKAAEEIAVTLDWSAPQAGRIAGPGAAG
ncbi:IclR family transcriptional regulator [Propylenella binzhouense]|uniref:IclR family transcriptional regulator n=1 Tax=Propylenella binzhouense TaxID=2555902 RepID=A0A964T7H3_9HYPH|nr:IclR family transcriptional regulator [Propylenella binzhouense]MYZ49961.1 IclR family transcriptional regulator [Propylenella binzhouense]